ncbi:hypothetical protein [Anaeromicropila populeti]|uniref:Uncharacterized protein n=1 Tax=Anaeromicropila populeti TaxID=37658 RepID=A0A1I6JFW8_9FIRM|nr:hypothetical protein [Anaeromicropila populeti]SFR77759.1 hypothetical protein SAMN05661086_01643 [Anaeromicropila populeti]
MSELLLIIMGFVIFSYAGWNYFCIVQKKQKHCGIMNILLFGTILVLPVIRVCTTQNWYGLVVKNEGRFLVLTMLSFARMFHLEQWNSQISNFAYGSFFSVCVFARMSIMVTDVREKNMADYSDNYMKQLAGNVLLAALLSMLYQQRIIRLYYCVIFYSILVVHLLLACYLQRNLYQIRRRKGDRWLAGRRARMRMVIERRRKNV